MPEMDDLRVNVTADTSGLIDSLERANEAVRSMGQALSVGFAQAVKTAAEFEQQMAAIEAVQKPSKRQRRSLRRKALKLGRETSFSATEGDDA